MTVEVGPQARRATVRAALVLIALIALTLLARPAGASATNPYTTAVLADHPVSYWRLNDAPGSSVAVDQEGLNPGQITGATLGEPGPFAESGSMRFEGSDYINLGKNPSLFPPTNWSIELWFKASPSDAAACAGMSGTDSCVLFQVHAFGMHLLLDPTDKLEGVFYPTSCECSQPSPGGAYDLLSPKGYADDAWHQADLVRDTHEFNLYVDGSLVASDPVTETTTHYGGDELGAIGGDPYYLNEFLTGWESEVSFYNYALSAAQVAAHYAAVPPVPPPPPPITVNTSAAANVGETFATLAGTLNTHGHAAYYRFELDFGQAGAGATYYGFATPTEQALAVDGNQPVYAPIGGLIPGASYNFALVVSYDGAFSSPTLGNILAFQTTAPPMTKKDKGFIGTLIGVGATAVGGVVCGGALLATPVTLGASDVAGCAAAGLGIVSFGVSLVEPPDSKYGVIFRPVPYTIRLKLLTICTQVHIQRGSACASLQRAARRYWTADGRVVSLAEALAVTVDRFGGAERAASTSGEALQRSGMLMYLTRLKAATAALHAAGGGFASQLGRDHYDPLFSARQIARGRHDLSDLKGMPLSIWPDPVGSVRCL